MSKRLKIVKGLVVGNVTNKQQVRNPIAKLLVKNFEKTFLDLLGSVDPESILEVGCGEGHLTQFLLSETSAKRISAVDISMSVLEEAKAKLDNPRISFYQRSIYDLTEDMSSDLVVCCEVLEHIDDPIKGVKSLRNVTKNHCLVSVPNEPLWRILNMARGSYLRDFGNTPGHMQHWSRSQFVSIMKSCFQVEYIRTPTPWTMALCRT